MRWPRPEWLLLAIISAIVAGGLFVVRPPAVEEKAQSTEEMSERTEDRATPSETAPSTSTPTSSLPEIDDSVIDKVSEAVMLYGSFPNPSGSRATLAQLNELGVLSSEALSAIESEWHGDKAVDVKYRVTDVIMGDVLPGDAPQELSIPFAITQQASFPNTPDEAYKTRVIVHLHSTEGEWLITKLSYDLIHSH